MGTPGVLSLVDRAHFWRLPMPFAAALAWLRAHPPAGLPPDGSTTSSGPSGPTAGGYGYAGPKGPAWESAELDVGIAPSGANASGMRIDGVVVWLDPRPVPAPTAGPRLRQSVGVRCPGSDRGIVGVRNTGRDLRHRLLPLAKPTAGLVCRYDGGNGRPWSLRGRTSLSTAAAGELAAVVARLPLSHPDGGVLSCPAADGTAALVAFQYPGRPDVDLWAYLNGCATVSNGYILAAGNLSQALGRIR
jgi:hypothetical protein